MNEDQSLLDEQIAYYRARASEYDEWFLRQNRYDHGPEHRREWFREIEEIRAVVRGAVRNADVLEVACGTGLWTEVLAENDNSIVAVDASREVIAINQQRVHGNRVEYQVADIFSWVPSSTFDVVFFSFWLSHVPADKFEPFWNLVRSALRSDGQAFFIDSLYEQNSSARDHGPVDRSGIVHRKLNDGREFQVVKVFYEPAELERRLVEIGWRGWVRSTQKFFLYGSMIPADALL